MKSEDSYYGYKKQNLKQKIFSAITGIHGPWTKTIYTVINENLISSSEIFSWYRPCATKEKKLEIINTISKYVDSKNEITQGDAEDIFNAIENTYRRTKGDACYESLANEDSELTEMKQFYKSNI